MEKIVRYGCFWRCHWFIRADGGRLFRFRLPRDYIYLLSIGVDLAGVNQAHIIGYYFDYRMNNAFGLILHEPGQHYEERHFLGYAENTPAFHHWFTSMLG